MIKILITGSNGQLGRSFLYWSSKFKDFKFSFADITELDLTKMSDIENYLKENVTHYVINCAAYTHVDNAELEVEKEKVFCDVSSTIKVSLNSLKSSVAPLRTMYCPAETS